MIRITGHGDSQEHPRGGVGRFYCIYCIYNRSSRLFISSQCTFVTRHKMTFIKGGTEFISRSEAIDHADHAKSTTDSQNAQVRSLIRHTAYSTLLTLNRSFNCTLSTQRMSQ